jgi:hypothetical protein
MADEQKPSWDLKAMGGSILLEKTVGEQQVYTQFRSVQGAVEALRELSPADAEAKIEKFMAGRQTFDGRVSA